MPDPEATDSKLIAPLRLRVDTRESLPPDPGGTAVVFSRLGYTLPQALADIVDNAIDAGACKVLIRFIRTENEIRRIEILNDGRGIDVTNASEVMRIGRSTGKSSVSLGKYGIGLKSASLSQANCFTVLSITGEGAIGRRWTQENIKEDWLCERLNEADVRNHMAGSFGPVKLDGNGTLIIWEQLHHLVSNKASIEKDLSKAVNSIKKDLGLWFHRFIEDERLKIYIDTQVSGRAESALFESIPPLDPFSYPQSGREGYPRRYKANLPGQGDLELEAHIWPPKSRLPGYLLGGGKVASRQGFYFYRNDRLIQVGGWNGCREDDSEPHLSLARVIVDLPASMDGCFQLDVTKSKINPPPQFPVQVLAARSIDGTTVARFLQDAQAAYRVQERRDSGTFKYGPGTGLPKKVRDKATEILQQKGAKKLAKVTFSWKKLPASTFVQLDREGRELTLNSLYRSKVLNGQKGSVTDAPIVKMLLLFLFHDELDRKASSEKYQDWLERVNQSLVAACEGME